MKNIILFFCGLLFSLELYAGAEVNNFKVVKVRADKDGRGYVRFDKPLAGTPATCINGHLFHLAFDLNTPGGKGIMSIVLAAQASGKSIKASGTSTCDIYGSVESWSWGYVTD